MAFPGLVETGKNLLRVDVRDRILSVIHDEYGFDLSGLIQQNRSKSRVKARKMAFYLLRRHTKMSLAEIGNLFQRDHSTVLHSIDRLMSEIAITPLLRREIVKIEAIIFPK